MFGYVQANLNDLDEREKNRYRAAYCGLCCALGQQHGFLSRLSLTYDLTFLTLLLSSLYEPEEQCGSCRCCVHPCKKHDYIINPCTNYAADMTIALTYHKCLDDWNDDRRLSAKGYAAMLKKQYDLVKENWPEQCLIIETSLTELSQIEKEQPDSLDAAISCFGHLMEGIFIWRKDHWEPRLRQLGFGLGQYIYLADAAVDLEQDRKTGNYNPLNTLSTTPLELRSTLMMLLGEASQAFETLPLVQDIHLLRNILYSGIWMKYNYGMQKQEKVTK